MSEPIHLQLSHTELVLLVDILEDDCERHEDLAEYRSLMEKARTFSILSRENIYRQRIERLQSENHYLAKRAKELEAAIDESRENSDLNLKNWTKAMLDARKAATELVDARKERDRLRDQLEDARTCLDSLKSACYTLPQEREFQALEEALKPAPRPAVYAQESADEAGPGGSETQVPGPEGIGALPRESELPEPGVTYLSTSSGDLATCLAVTEFETYYMVIVHLLTISQDRTILAWTPEQWAERGPWAKTKVGVAG